jgi:hypothetical protein
MKGLSKGGKEKASSGSVQFLNYLRRKHGQNWEWTMTFQNLGCCLKFSSYYKNLKFTERSDSTNVAATACSSVLAPNRPLDSRMS